MLSLNEMIPPFYLKTMQKAAQNNQLTYLGVTVVQAKAAWTRVGPTWLLPGIGYFVAGPGVADWGTKLGLAELAISTSPTPTFHAEGLSCAPEPNIVFAVRDEVAAHLGLTDLHEEAIKMMEEDIYKDPEMTQ